MNPWNLLAKKLMRFLEKGSAKLGSSIESKNEIDAPKSESIALQSGAWIDIKTTIPGLSPVHYKATIFFC